MPGREIRIATEDGEFTAWLTTPDTGHGPGLLVLPEIYNINGHIRGVADSYAAEGYCVIAPDVFWRIEPDRFLHYTPDGQTQARALNQRLDVDRLVIDLGACFARLKSLPECTGKVGAMGFCLGGKLAYLCAARHRVDAAVSYYGVGIENYLAEASAISCPILLHFAANDARVPQSAVATVKERLDSDETATIHIYPGAEHGFNRKGYPSFHPHAASVARERTLAHFAAHLT